MERILWGGESRGGSGKGKQLVQALARWTWGPMTLPGRFCSPLPDTGEPDRPRILLPLVALGKRSSMPLTAVPPAFAVMVRGHPDISGACGCEWGQAERLRVAPMSLSFTSRPGCDSRGK